MISKADLPPGADSPGPLNRTRGSSPTINVSMSEPVPSNSAVSGTEPSACESPTALHDLAALLDGKLSPEGLDRLAQHVMQCETCKVHVTLLRHVALEDVDSTGQHRAAPPQEQRDR